MRPRPAWVALSVLRIGLVAAAVVAVGACSSEGSEGAESVATSSTASSAPDEVVEPVGTTVPLDLVIFDTFDGGSVPLSEASPALVEALVDTIPPIDNPKYDEPGDAIWLLGDDFVLGYVAGDGQAYAYPHKILNFHEIVNDTLAGVPVLISYCPLCNSGVVFDRRVDGAELTFGNTSALYENDLVMLDRQTSSYWWQVPGRAIVGSLSGTELVALPSLTMTWANWLALHPETVVLSTDTGFARDYSRNPFVGYADRVNDGQTPFPVSAEAMQDDRLLPATLVIGVEVQAEAAAVPLEASAGLAIHETVGGSNVVVLVDEAGQGGGVYEPVAGDMTLTLTPAGNSLFTDAETNSSWDVAGRAIGGPLAGTQLPAIGSRTTFWFAYVASFPHATGAVS